MRARQATVTCTAPTRRRRRTTRRGAIAVRLPPPSSLRFSSPPRPFHQAAMPVTAQPAEAPTLLPPREAQLRQWLSESPRYHSSPSPPRALSTLTTSYSHHRHRSSAPLVPLPWVSHVAHLLASATSLSFTSSSTFSSNSFYCRRQASNTPIEAAEELAPSNGKGLSGLSVCRRPRSCST